MLDIRRVLAVFLQMLSGLQNAVGEAGDFTALELGVCGTVRDTAHELLQLLLEEMDRKLQEERDKTRWALIHRKPRTLVTTAGEITIWRRYYRDKQTGERRFLLDDALGLEPHRRLSLQLRSQAIALAMETSYRRAASLWQAWRMGLEQREALLAGDGWRGMVEARDEHAAAGKTSTGSVSSAAGPGESVRARDEGLPEGVGGLERRRWAAGGSAADGRGETESRDEEEADRAAERVSEEPLGWDCEQ